MLVYDSEKVKEKIWLILSELWAWMLPQFNIMSPYINTIFPFIVGIFQLSFLYKNLVIIIFCPKFLRNYLFMSSRQRGHSFLSDCFRSKAKSAPKFSRRLTVTACESQNAAYVSISCSATQHYLHCQGKSRISVQQIKTTKCYSKL